MLTTDPNTNQWEPPQYRVYTRRSWAMPWIDHGPMRNMVVTESIGSQIGRATWESYRGNIADGNKAPAISGERFDSLIGSWCKIVWTPKYPEPVSQKTWYGFLTDVDRVDLGGDAFDYGCTAHSVEWILTRHQLTRSRVETNAGATNVEIQRALEVNGFRSDQFGRQITSGNMSQVPNIDGVRVFAKDLSNPRVWNAKEFLRYMLKYYTPGTDITPVWELDLAGDADDVLFWYEPNLQVHGRTLFEIINSLIPVQRGVVWRTEVNESINLIAIRLSTTLARPIQLNDKIVNGETRTVVIPRNPSRVDLTLLGQQHIRQAVTRVSEQQVYQQVCVVGDRAGAIFTLSVGDELVKDWTDEEETEYKRGAADATGYSIEPFATRAQWSDSARMSPKLQHVYSRYVLKPEWDGKAVGIDVTADPDELANQEQEQNEEPEDTGPANPFWQSGLRFESYLPLKQGFKYSDPEEPTQQVEAQSEGYQKPFVTVALLPTTKYEYVDKLASTAFDEHFGSGIHWACHIEMMRDKPGIALNPHGCPHLIATEDFDPNDSDNAETEQIPLTDYNTIEATVFVKFDHFCSGVWPSTRNQPVRPSDIDSVHYIQIGERAQLITMPEGTLVALDNGDKVRCEKTGYIRDDRQLCEDIARTAWEYYATPRTAINVSLNMISGHVRIGQLITSYEGQAVNSIVSSITWDFAGNTTTISTQFAELDFAGLA